MKGDPKLAPKNNKRKEQLIRAYIVGLLIIFKVSFFKSYRCL